MCQASQFRRWPRLRLWHLIVLVLVSALIFSLIREGSGLGLLFLLPTMAVATMIHGRRLARRISLSLLDRARTSGEPPERIARVQATLVHLLILLAAIAISGFLVAVLGFIVLLNSP